MKHWKQPLAVLLAVLLVFGLFGCGTTPGTEPSPSGVPEDAAKDPAETDPGDASAAEPVRWKTAERPLGLSRVRDICTYGDGYLVSSDSGISRLNADFTPADPEPLAGIPDFHYDLHYESPDLVKVRENRLISVAFEGGMSYDGGWTYTVFEDAQTLFFVDSPRGWGFKGAQLYCCGEDVYICNGEGIQKNGLTMELPQEDGYRWDPRALVETADGPCALLTKFSVMRTEPICGVLVPLDGVRKKLTLDNAAPLQAELLKARTFCPPESGCVYADGMLWRTGSEGFTLVADLSLYGVDCEKLIRILSAESGEICCLTDSKLIVLTPDSAAAEPGDPSAPAQRITLRIGTLYLYNQLNAFVNYVNLHGTGCRLKVKVYEEREQLDRAVLSGEVDLVGDPEILALKNYAQKGLLQPLDSAVPELPHPELFYQNMLDALAVNGKHCLLPITMTPCVDLLPKRYGVAPEELNSFPTLIRMLEEKEPEFFAWESREYAFNNWLYESMEHWIDEEAGTADFESEDFLALLNACARCPETAEEAIAAQPAPDAYDDLPRFKRRIPLDIYNGAWEDYLIYRIPFRGRSTIILDEPVCIAALNGVDAEALRGLLQILLLDDNWHSYVISEASLTNRVRIFLNRAWTEADLELQEQAALTQGYINVEESVRLAYMLYVDQVRELFLEANCFGGNYTMMDVINEEAQPFFHGDCTAEEAACRIQNRVEIYLAEHR